MIDTRDALVAGGWAALLSGAPSTAHALLVNGRPLETTLAAGSMVLPGERRTARLVLAALPVHLALSWGWALIIGRVLPRRGTVTWGAAAGLAIAALDLGVVGRRFPRVRGLPTLPQIADHMAYGAAVGTVLARRRERRTQLRHASRVASRRGGW